MVDISSPECLCATRIPDLRPAADVGSVHEKVYTDIASDDLESGIQPEQEKNQRADFDLSRLTKVLPPRSKLRILEIGPGDGVLSRKLAVHHELYVMDITDEYIRRFDFVTGAFVADIETMPFVEEFDHIILCDVLEHVLNEGDALLSVRRALRPSGTIYIRCPSNEPSVAYARTLGSPYPYVHLRSYSTGTLERAATAAGISVSECRYVRLSPAGYARRDFGIAALRKARAKRYVIDLFRAHRGLTGVPPINRIDWFVGELESMTWRVGNRVSRRATKAILQRVWYRPSEVYMIGRKLPFEFDNQSSTII